MAADQLQIVVFLFVGVALLFGALYMAEKLRGRRKKM